MNIQSDSNPAIFYKVVKEGKNIKCSCMDFKYRGHLRPCKHINQAIPEFQDIKQEIHDDWVNKGKIGICPCQKEKLEA